jgi:glycosyltransferase involved in cell wall biosynthesis
MKIGFFSSAFGIGGTERNIIQISRYLKGKGIDIKVILLRSNQALSTCLERDLIEVYTFNLSAKGILSGNLIKLIKFMRDSKFDIIQLFGLKTNLIMRLLKSFSGWPKLITAIRSTDDWRKWYHVMLDRLTAPFVDLYISNSLAGKLAVIKREKVDEHKILVIHNSINMDNYRTFEYENKVSIRKRFNINPEDFVICEIANMREMKGHKLVIDAIAEIIKKHKNVKVVFSGSDNSNGEIPEYIKNRGLEEYFILTGFISDIKPILGISELFILPSLWEGLPTSILEAMAMKVPVIATNVGGIPELIGNGAGIIIPPNDSAEIVNAVIQLIEHNELRREYIENAYDRVRSGFDEENVMREIMTAYQNVLGGK